MFQKIKLSHVITSLRQHSNIAQIMDTSSKPTALLCILLSLFLVSSAQQQTCSNYTFRSNRVFNSCTDLPYLQAHLHWTYIPSTGKVEIAYRASQTSQQGWIAWAINPTATGMVGSQALVTFRNPNGSMTVFPTPITSYTPPMVPATLAFQVSNVSAEYLEKEMIVFAVVGPLDSGTIVDHVWQAGDSVSDNIPQIHGMSNENLQSMGRLDFLQG